jgi:hypothetical protein
VLERGVVCIYFRVESRAKPKERKFGISKNEEQISIISFPEARETATDTQKRMKIFKAKTASDTDTTQRGTDFT